MATTPGTIKHRKQATLPPAGYEIDSPQWNDSEVVAGGSNGQVITRDTTQTDGWGWGTPTAGPLNLGTTGQIVFPATQVPSSNPNVLDDYEEGPWTPFIGGNTGYSGQTYAVQAGQYTKIGRQVTVHFEVAFAVKGTISGAGLFLYGLPFAAAAASGGWSAPYVSTVRFANLATNWIIVYCLMQVAQSYAIFQGLQAAGPNAMGAGLSNTDILNSSGFSGDFRYTV